MQKPFALAVLGLGLLLVGCRQDELVNKEDAPVTAKTAPEMLAPQPASFGTPGEGVVSQFNKRVEDYVALRKREAARLPNLPDPATPEQVDANQRALLDRMARARANAKIGDVFSPEMQTFIRGLVKRVFTGSDGARIKASVMDENPMGVKITINGRYPDTVPMATMPSDVLAALPTLPEELEYRFVGNRLILLDVASHLILDYVEHTFDV